MSNEKDTIQVEENTGEVIENNTYTPGQGKVVFRSMWSNPYGVVGQDLSNTKEEIFEEVPAFAIDPDTGKLLNETSQPKLISKGFIDVQERIQSFAKDTDIYAILEKFAFSGDATLLKARDCEYGDISELPKNLNDYAQYLNAHFKALDELNPELAKKIIDPNVKPEEIEALANSIYEGRIKDFEASKASNNGGAE